jgi:hypothetical protein
VLREKQGGGKGPEGDAGIGWVKIEDEPTVVKSKRVANIPQCVNVCVCVMYRQSWTNTNTHHTLRHLDGRVCVRMVCVGRVAPDDGTLENVLFVCSDLRAIHQFKAAAPSKGVLFNLGSPSH